MATTKGRKRPTYDRIAMQRRVLDALVGGATLGQACTTLGLRRVTVWRWTRSDAVFASDFERAAQRGLLVAKGLNTASLSSVDLAYAAGVFDGEGCVRVHRGPMQKNGRRYFMPFVQLTNTHVGLVQHFHDRWPGYWERDKANGKNPNAKPYSSWKLGGAMAEQFLRDVYPYLMVKRPQADLIAEFRAFVGTAPRRNKDRTDEEYARLVNFHARSRQLNARGTQPVVVKTD